LAFKLCLITDDLLRPAEELAARVDAALRGGVDAVQFREKSAPPEQLHAAFTALSRVCRAHDAPLLLNGALLGTFQINEPLDGIHCGIGNLPPDFAAAFAKARADADFPPPSIHDAWQKAIVSHNTPIARRLIIGYSAHEIGEAGVALRCGADYVTLSPVFPTPSKQGIIEAHGADWIREARQSLANARIIALGGISLQNAAEVMQAGASGIAVIRAVMAADDPCQAARLLYDLISKSAAI